MRRLLGVLTGMVIFSLSLAGFCEAVTQYRGVMISPQVKAADLQTLGAWNVNFVRWQLNMGIGDAAAYSVTPEAYDAWLEQALTNLDQLLPVCERNGIKVLIDLHTTPGGRNSSDENMIFKEIQYQTKFIQIWNKIALRYKGNQTVWGYDLANEPHPHGGVMSNNLMGWQQLATHVARNIRSIDSEHTIVVALDSDTLDNFTLLPASISNVTYTIHFYRPWKFVSQGIPPNTAAFKYPGVVNRVMWDKAQLRKNLQSVSKFQKQNGVRILVGEFSAVRWTPAGSTYNYLKDLIDIFEENGWDWTYHAFREWNGWSVEHTEDKKNNNPSTVQTKREKLLRSYFSKNSKN